jgi:hypothetical protein
VHRALELVDARSTMWSPPPPAIPPFVSELLVRGSTGLARH